MHKPDDMPVYPPALDRRVPTEAESMLQLVSQIHQKVDDLDKRLTQQTHDATLKLAEEIAALMCKAFPGEDPDGHRKFHEEQMQIVADRAEFWKKMRFEICKWGIAGLLGWLVVIAWRAVLQGPK